MDAGKTPEGTHPDDNVIVLALAQLRLDGGTQPRAAVDPATVLEYAAAMAAGNRFPPVVVFHDGAAYWLTDGFHRVQAAERAGRSEIAAYVHQGDRRAAVLYSTGVNSDHGLRRTNTDKRRAVLALLGDAEWSRWSDREIARQCKVSDRFVNNLRAGLSANDSQTDGARTVVRGGSASTSEESTLRERRFFASVGRSWG